LGLPQLLKIILVALQYLSSMNPVSVILFVGAARVKQRGQWAEPNFHLCDRYLPYARGGGYIVSGDLVKYISDNKDLLQIYNSEDVSMGK